MVRVGIVLTFTVDDAEDVPAILRAIDPERLPHFDGEARITVEPHLSALLDWLDG